MKIPKLIIKGKTWIYTIDKLKSYKNKTTEITDQILNRFYQLLFGKLK